MLNNALLIILIVTSAITVSTQLSNNINNRVQVKDQMCEVYHASAPMHLRCGKFS